MISCSERWAGANASGGSVLLSVPSMNPRKDLSPALAALHGGAGAHEHGVDVGRNELRADVGRDPRVQPADVGALGVEREEAAEIRVTEGVAVEREYDARLHVTHGSAQRSSGSERRVFARVRELDT